MANRKQSPQSASLLAPPKFGTPGSGYWLPPGSFSSEDEEDDLAGSTFRLIPCASPRPKHHSSSEEEDDDDEEGEGSKDTPGPLTLMAALNATPASGRRRVSFADSFGLELTAVRVYGHEEGKHVTMEQPPGLDSHVMLIDGIGDGQNASSAGATASSLYLEPEWRAHADLLKSLSTTKVELESLEPEPEDLLTARGLVRVLNISYDKHVSVRRTLDSWQTYSDVRSRYESEVHDDYSDRFSFLLTVPRGIARPGLRLEFAVRYCTPFAEFWANNGGQNFVLCCRSRAPCGEPAPELSGVPAPEVSMDVEPEKNLKSCLKVTSGTDKEDLEQVLDNVPSVAVHADNYTAGHLPTLQVNECASVLKDNVPHLTVISPSGNDIYVDYKNEVVNAEKIKHGKDGPEQDGSSNTSPESRVPFLRKRRLVDYKKHKDAAEKVMFSALHPESDYDSQSKDVKVLSSNLTRPHDEVEFASIEPPVVENVIPVTILQTVENEVTELVPIRQPFEVLEGIDDQPNTDDLDNIAICHSPIVSEEVPQDVELLDKVESRGDANLTGFQQVLVEEVESAEQEKQMEPELTHDSEIASLSVKACREQLGFTPVEPLQGSEALVNTTIGENNIDAYLETLLIEEKPSEEEFVLFMEAERHARLPINPVIMSEAFGKELDEYSPAKVFDEADVEVGTRDREGQDYYIEGIVQTSLDEDFPLSLCSADVERPIEHITCEQNIPISLELNAVEHGVEGLLSVEKVMDSKEETISAPEEHEDFVKSLQPPVEEVVIQREIDMWPQKHEFDHEPSLISISSMESPGSGVIPSDNSESSQKQLVTTEVKLQTFDVEDNVSNRLFRSPPRKIIEVASCGDVEDEIQQEIMNVADGQRLYSEELTMEKEETLKVDDVPVYVETKRNVPFLTEEPKTIHKTEDVKDLLSNQTETAFLITTHEQLDFNRPEPFDVETELYVSKIDTFQTEEESKIEMPSPQVMDSAVLDKDWKPMSVQQLEEEYGSLLAEDNAELEMPSCEKYFESKPIVQKGTQEKKRFEEREPIVPEGMLELSLQVSLSPYEPEIHKESDTPRKIIEVASCGDVEDEIQQEIMNVADDQRLYSEELTMEKEETLKVDDVPVYVETKRNVPFLTEEPKTIHKTEDVKDLLSKQTKTAFLITTHEQLDFNRPEPFDVETERYVSKIDTFQTEEESKIEMPSPQVMDSAVLDKDWKPMSVQQLEEEYGSLLAEDNAELEMPSCEKYFESKPIVQKGTQEKKRFEDREPIVPEGMLELSLQVSLSPYEPEIHKESDTLRKIIEVASCGDVEDEIQQEIMNVADDQRLYSEELTMEKEETLKVDDVPVYVETKRNVPFLTEEPKTIHKTEDVKDLLSKQTKTAFLITTHEQLDFNRPEPFDVETERYVSKIDTFQTEEESKIEMPSPQVMDSAVLDKDWKPMSVQQLEEEYGSLLAEDNAELEMPSCEKYFESKPIVQKGTQEKKRFEDREPIVPEGMLELSLQVSLSPYEPEIHKESDTPRKIIEVASCGDVEDEIQQEIMNVADGQRLYSEELIMEKEETLKVDDVPVYVETKRNVPFLTEEPKTIHKTEDVKDLLSNQTETASLITTHEQLAFNRPEPFDVETELYVSKIDTFQTEEESKIEMPSPQVMDSAVLDKDWKPMSVQQLEEEYGSLLAEDNAELEMPSCEKYFESKPIVQKGTQEKKRFEEREPIVPEGMLELSLQVSLSPYEPEIHKESDTLRKIIEVASCGDVEDEIQQEIMNVADDQRLYSEELTMEKEETLKVDDVPVYVETKRNVPFLTEEPKTIHKTEDVKDLLSKQTKTAFLITTHEQLDFNRPEPFDVETERYVSKIDTFQTEEESKIEMPSPQVMDSAVLDKDWKPMSVQQLEEEYGSLLAEGNAELEMPSCEKYFESKPIVQKGTQEKKRFEEREPIVPEGMLELSLQVSLSPYEPEIHKESEESERHFSLDYQELVEDSTNAPRVSEEHDYLQGPVWAETMYVSDSLMYPPLENEVDRMPWNDKSWEPIMEDAKAPVSLHAEVPLEAAKNNLQESTVACEETEVIGQAGEGPLKASLEKVSVGEATEEPAKSFLGNEQQMKTVWDPVQEIALIQEECLTSTPKWQACAEVHDYSMEQKAQGNVLEEHKDLGELFNEVEIKCHERLPSVEQPILKEQTIHDINKSEDKVGDEKRVVERSKIEEQIEDHNIIVSDVVEDESCYRGIDLHSRPTDIHKAMANEEPPLDEGGLDHLPTSQRLKYKGENVGEEQWRHVDEGLERSVPKASPKEMENAESKCEATGLETQHGEEKNLPKMQVDQHQSEREVKFYEDHTVPVDLPPIRIRLRQAVHSASVFLLFLIFLAVLSRYDLTVCCVLFAVSLFILWLI
uniref:uncharacterized protein n=1 Tax=Myxine glutinosa TaxID=7769 RepID=UPI00358E8CA8